MSTHSKTGASSMYRWSVCPGSVREAAKVPAYSSGYAEEGNEAHDLAARCLRSLTCEPGIFEDAETFEAVDVYYQYVTGNIFDGDKLLVEHKFDLSSVYPGCFGTADAAIYKPAEKLLVVVDYKHGAGIPVEVVGNPQLDYYALGALLTCGFVVNTVRKVIVQPRCPHRDGPVRWSEVAAIDLLDFRADLIGFAKKTEAPDAALVPGDHCRFCPAAGVCPALHSQAIEVAKLVFKPALAYDPAQLAKALDARDAVKAWITNLDQFAYREAEAGRCPPGYKLVAKRAVRSWASEGGAAELLADLGVADAAIYEPREVKSPAKVEALFPKKRVPDALAALIKSESSGHTLVHESDPRPAAASAAALDFKPVPQTTAKETA